MSFSAVDPCSPFRQMDQGACAPTHERSTSQARAAARTVDQMMAVTTMRTPFAMSPYSKRTIPNEADVGWAAGILDGEGCIHIACQTFPATSKRRPNYRLRVHIAQTSRTLLEEFEWVVGICGTITQPEVTNKQRRVCYSLSYDGLSAFAVVEFLFEHLRRKRPMHWRSRTSGVSATSIRIRDRTAIRRRSGSAASGTTSGSGPSTGERREPRASFG